MATVIQCSAVPDHVGFSSSSVFTLGLSVVSGDFIVVVTHITGGPPASVSDNFGTIYTNFWTSSDTQTAAYIGTLSNSGTCTITVHVGGSGIGGNVNSVAWEISGLTGVLDVSAYASTLNAGPAPVTTTVANDLILLFSATGSGTATFTAGGSTVLDAQAASALGNSVSGGHIVATAAATYTPNLTNNAVSVYEADVTLAMKTTGGGSSFNPFLTMNNQAV